MIPTIFSPARVPKEHSSVIPKTLSSPEDPEVSPASEVSVTRPDTRLRYLIEHLVSGESARSRILRTCPASSAELLKLRPLGFTFTPHPTLHPAYVRAFEVHLRSKGLCIPGSGPSRTHLSREQILIEFRAFLLSHPIDPKEVPSSRDESEIQITGLLLIMFYHWEDLLAQSTFLKHFRQPLSWCGRDHDGTNLPPGALILIRCMEIAAVCSFYTDILSRDSVYKNKKGDTVFELLEDTRKKAHKLGELAGRVSSLAIIKAYGTILIEQLNIALLERALVQQIHPDHPLKELIAKFGLGGFGGQARISSRDLGKAKMHEILNEIQLAASLSAVESIVIADCQNRDNVLNLRIALDKRGLESVKIIPLLEDYDAIWKHINKNEYQGCGVEQIMMAGSDYPKQRGVADTILTAVRFIVVNKSCGFESYLGRGVSPFRQGEGNSETAGQLFHGAMYEDRIGPIATQYTRQGAASVISLFSFEAFKSVIRGYGLPMKRDEFLITMGEISEVDQIFTPLMIAEVAERAPDSPFAQSYKKSRLPTIAIPLAGSRDKINKDPVIKGPFDDRAIKVFTRLGLVGSAFFGQEFSQLTAEERDGLVNDIRRMKAKGTVGQKYLVDMIMYNFGMQAAMLHNPATLVKIWQACEFSPRDILAMKRSVLFITSLLKETGYSIQSNGLLQEMVCQNYALPFKKEDLSGNSDRIRRHMDLMQVKQLEFLLQDGSFRHVVAMTQMSRL
jgi:hypothetical protein